MRNFKLDNNEDLIKVLKDIEVEANKNRYELTLFLTTKRLVLLKDANKELEYNDFLAARMVAIPENLEVVFEVNFAVIKEIKYKTGMNIITFKNNNNELKLYCEDITKLIK